MFAGKAGGTDDNAGFFYPVFEVSVTPSAFDFEAFPL